VDQSSQFASALLLVKGLAGWRVKVVGKEASHSPYVEMTRHLIDVFPREAGSFQVEPDASGGSYFWAAGRLTRRARSKSRDSGGAPEPSSILSVEVAYWPKSEWQIDASFPAIFRQLATGSPWFDENATGPFPPTTEEAGPEPLHVSRRTDLGDSIMTAITLAPLAGRPMIFNDLGRLRVQECERVAALRTELTRCGARVKEVGESLEVTPSALHGATIETYGDHRMAMCFSILGLKIPGMKIKDPACVRKTFPTFFQKLSAAPPRGMGAQVLNEADGSVLSSSALLAE
jgi:3-phosphoshikimate 1-carboxyvinyltransferase